MRTFRAYVGDDGKVGCNPKTMHVPPHFYEEIAVCLDDAWVRTYKLFVDVGKDPKGCLEKQRLNTSAIVLRDDNSSPCDLKFTIKLRPLPKSNAPKLDALDPMIVNE